MIGRATVNILQKQDVEIVHYNIAERDFVETPKKHLQI